MAEKTRPVIEEVAETVKARGDVYGPPHKNFEVTADLWSAFLGVEITPAQVTACMMLVKVARLKQTPDHRDSMLDIAGYVHCYEDCINHSEQSEGDDEGKGKS